jgi:hypothetical protein
MKISFSRGEIKMKTGRDVLMQSREHALLNVILANATTYEDGTDYPAHTRQVRKIAERGQEKYD